MSDEVDPQQQPDPESSEQPQTPPPPAKKKSTWRKLRWPVYILVGLLLIVGLLVALAPSILSSDWGKGMVLAQVNQMLHGKVEVQEWSFSWSSPTRITGVRVTDDQGRQVAQVESIQLTPSVGDVVGMLRGGSIDLGTGNKIKLDVNVEIFPDGSINLAKLPNLPPSDKPLVLPDMKGEVEAEIRATIVKHEADGSRRAIYLDPSTVKIKVSDINGFIENQVKLAIRTDAGQAGTIALDGKVKLFEKGEINLAKLDAEQGVKIQGLDLAAAQPFLPPGSIDKLKGLTDFTLQVRAAGADSLVASGSAMVQQFELGGAMFKGDALTSPKLSIVIPETTFNRTTGRIATSKPIVLTSAQGTVSVSADTTIDAIQKLAAQQAPGASGKVAADVSLNGPVIASQLRNFLGMHADITPTAGTLTASVNVSMLADRATLTSNVSLPDLAATRGPNKEKVTLPPVTFNAGATTLGGKGMVPDLRDISLDLQSGFAKLKIAGTTLANISTPEPGEIKLKELESELAKFVDLGGVKLDGLLTLTLKSSGDLTQADGKSEITLDLKGQNLQVLNVLSQPINQPRLDVQVKGTLIRGPESFIQQVRDAVVTASAGADPAKPTLDMRLTGGAQLGKALAATFAIEKLAADLPRLQAELPGVINLPASLKVGAGALSVKGAGSMNGPKIDLSSLTASIEGLDLSHEGKSVLSNYTASLNLAAEITSDPKSLIARIRGLDVKDNQNLLKVWKQTDGDLMFSMVEGKGIDAGGSLGIFANLPPIYRIKNAFGGRQGGPEITSGNLTGTIAAARKPDGISTITADLAIDPLSIATSDPARSLKNEKVTIVVKASAADRFLTFNGQQIALTTSFANITATDVLLKLFEPRGAELVQVAALDMPQSAKLAINVPDVPKLQSLLDALMLASVTKPGTEEEPEALPPLVFNSGKLEGNITVGRAAGGLELKVDSLEGKSIGFVRGEGKQPPINIAVKLRALLQTAPGADPIKGVQVTALSLSSPMAQVKLKDPIALAIDGTRYSASGTVTLDGPVDLLCRFLEAYGGNKPNTMQYAGTYTGQQALTTRNNVLALVGNLNVKDVIVGDPKNPTLREPLLLVENDVQVNQAAKVLDLSRLRVVAQGSKALDLSVRGKVNKYHSGRDRELDGVVLTLGYDAAKVYELVKPMLPPDVKDQLKTLKVSGVVAPQDIRISGRYPDRFIKDARGRGRKPIYWLKVDGATTIPNAEFAGMKAQQADLAFHMRDGVLAIGTYVDGKTVKPIKLIQIAGGTADLNGVRIDMTAPSPRITLPVADAKKPHQLLTNVQATDEFVSTYLGSVSPWFANAVNASGKISVRVSQLDRVPLGTELLTPKAGDPSSASLAFDLTDFQMDAPFVGDVLKLVATGNAGSKEKFNIQNATVSLKAGKVASMVPFPLAGHVLNTSSNIDLGTWNIQSMVIGIPQELSGKWVPKELRGVMFADSKYLDLPFKGSLTKPVPDEKAILDQVKKKATGGLLQGLPGLLGGDKPKDPPKEQPKETPKPQPKPQPKRPATNP